MFQQRPLNPILYFLRSGRCHKLYGLAKVLSIGLLIFSLVTLPIVSYAQDATNSDGAAVSEAAETQAPTTPPPTLSSIILSLFQTTPQLQTEWVRLNGTRIFQIAGSDPALSERHHWIQSNLQRISRDYVADPTSQLNVEVAQSNQQPVIYLNGQYLLTVTDLDAQIYGIDPQLRAEQLKGILTRSMENARSQHQRPYLITQARLLIGLLVGCGITSFLLSRWQHRVKYQPVTLLGLDTNPAIKKRSRLHQTRVREVKRLLLQLGQFMLWIGGSIFGLSRFPQTRNLAVYSISLLKVPLVLGLIIIGSYILTRLSHILIDRFSLAASSNPLLPTATTDRAQQRIGTISQVIKSLSFLLIALLGLISVLLLLGVNVGPYLAGAGIFGLSISLSFQWVVRDAINGFLIILEDQYGVGDIIQIGEWTGLVEALNLRITQLRSAKGQLVTIPNSEIKAVANLSSQWARVDLDIPIPYDANLEEMMELIQSTALAMQADEHWQESILETPQLMGVEDLSAQGLVLKLWIKTKPLKQWDVAREYRKRLKIALDLADMKIPAS